MITRVQTLPVVFMPCAEAKKNQLRENRAISITRCTSIPLENAGIVLMGPVCGMCIPQPGNSALNSYISGVCVGYDSRCSTLNRRQSYFHSSVYSGQIVESTQANITGFPLWIRARYTNAMNNTFED